MMCQNLIWITLTIATLYITGTSSAAASYSTRKRPGSISYPSVSSSSSSGYYSLFKSSRYSAPSRYKPMVVTSYPGGTRKRTMYTGRFCAYLKTKMVPHKVPNGTETYLKQVVKNCHWSALYCKQGIHYVVSSRITYKTVMKKVTKEEWKCCPGFEGENCDNACYNCTTMHELNERVSELEEQMATGIPTTTGDGTVTISRGQKGDQGEVGPVGPRGPVGEAGETGPRGPVGAAGAKGEQGRPGVAGETGPRGQTGEKGERGFQGPTGDQGSQGPPGPAGKDGNDGKEGPPGPKGERGMSGIAGIKGDKGERGAVGKNGTDGTPGPEGPPGAMGTAGLKGEPGERGRVGPPGPPGACDCSKESTAEPTTRPEETTTTGGKEDIDPGGLFPGGVTPDGIKGNSGEKETYCERILWQQPLANLSCDFGPVKRKKNSLRLKKRSTDREKIHNMIYERSKRQRGDSPTYFVMDDLKPPEDYGDIPPVMPFSEDPQTPDILSWDDISDPGDSGGTYCLWDSSPIMEGETDTSQKTWKLQRLSIPTTLDPEYYADFMEEIKNLPDTESDETADNYMYGLLDLPPAPLISEPHVRKKRNVDEMDLLMYAEGPPYDATTASTLGDGYYLIWKPESPQSDLVQTSEAQFSSPFFTNPHPGICLNFKYFIHTDSHKTTSRTINGGLLVYLLPCKPSYKIPVLNLTGEEIANKTNRWVDATAPLPRHVHPYQVIFEGVRPEAKLLAPSPADNTENMEELSKVVYVALDDIVFTECGKCSGCDTMFMT